jgi:hypothetical protein
VSIGSRPHLAANPELEWTDMVRQTLVQHTWALRLFELAGKHGRQDPVLTRLAQMEMDRLRGK